MFSAISSSCPFQPLGQLQGRFVEVIALAELSYCSLVVVEPEVAAKLQGLILQTG